MAHLKSPPETGGLRAKLAQEVIPEGIDRGIYWILCQYSHPHYSVSRPGKGDQDWEVMRYFALMSPLDCALGFYHAFTGHGGPDEMKALCDEIRDTTIGNQIEAP
jgi:hypothetical protein